MSHRVDFGQSSRGETLGGSSFSDAPAAIDYHLAAIRDRMTAGRIAFPDSIVANDHLCAMNCDEIFEALTSRGGPSRPEVRRHLAGCPRCRDLADALALLDVPMPAGPQPDVSRLLDVPAPFRAVRAAAESAERLAIPAGSATCARSERSGRSRQRWMSAGWGRQGLRYALAFFSGAAASLGVAALLHSGLPVSASAMVHDAALVATDSQKHRVLCLWTTRKTPTSQSPEPSNSNDIILSCVACHLRMPDSQ